MKKDLKRQMKQDDLVTGFQAAAAFAEKHRDEMRVTAIVVVLLAAGAVGLQYFQQHRAQQAGEAFGSAMEAFHAPLANELPEGAPKPAGPLMADATEKFKRAAAAFDGVERRWPSLPVALRARYYAALCRIELGDFGEAKKALTQVAAVKEADAVEPALARLAIAEVERRTNEIDKAVEAYRSVVDDSSVRFPRDHALMSLASTLEDARRLREAQAAYRRLSQDYPESVYAAEARRRADYLGTGVGS